jgi:hypothetical protein
MDGARQGDRARHPEGRRREMSDLYLRKVGLAVIAGQKALDLSQMRITFRIQAADVEAPGTAHIRVYNLADHTAQSVQKEYQTVTLQAGYKDGPYGVIFQGTIKQVKRGREMGGGGVVDSYVELLCADGDLAYNFGVVNATIAAGSTPTQRAQAVARHFSKYGVNQAKLDHLSSSTSSSGGILPRGKVFFGMGRDYLDDVAASTATTWSIQNGVLTFTSMTGYQPGEAVVLTSRTGLVGVPEATDQGIRVRCLLNPFIQVGRRVQIDNKSINRITIKQQGFPRYSDVNFTADVSADGYYRVLVREFVGDSRGHDWFADLICLSVDGSAAVNQSVKAYG